MAVNLSPVGGVAAQFFTNTGAVLTGGKLYTYAAGTTTPQTTFTSSNGGTAWTNPIVLDAAGRVPSGGEIWLTDGISYKFVLKDSNDVLIATYDNITGINSNSVSFTNQQQIVTATANQTVFNLSISYQPGTNSLSVFVDGVNQYGPGAQYAYTETDSDTVTFVSGLHVGAQVKFTTTQQQGAGAVNASQVTYNPAGATAVATNVQTKLRETISVKDFGATGDGTTDDTTAINNAIAYLKSLARGGNLYFPAGTYSVSSVNASSFGDAFSKNLRMYGDGIFASRIVGNTTGKIVVDCIGSNNIEIAELFIGNTGGAVPQTGLLLARSTTSQNCNGGRITNISIDGSFSIAACISIAAESTVWVAPRFSNTNSSANYTTFYTSISNNMGVTSDNGTIFASSNTDVTMFKPTFYAPFNGAYPVRFYGGAGYDIYSGFVVCGNGINAKLITYEVIAGTGIFRGEVVWHEPLFEGASYDTHYLIGDAAVTNYFYGINQKGGYCNHYTAAAFPVVLGDTTGGRIAQYQLFDCEFSSIRFNPGGVAPYVSVYVLNNTFMDLLNTNSSATVIVTGYTANSTIRANVYNLTGTSAGVPIQIGGTAPPTTGTYPKNFIVWNENPSSGGYVGWVCTTAGTPGTWKTFGLIS